MSVGMPDCKASSSMMIPSPVLPDPVMPTITPCVVRFRASYSTFSPVRSPVAASINPPKKSSPLAVMAATDGSAFTKESTGRGGP